MGCFLYMSPKGVNYYELICSFKTITLNLTSFRPQQRLTIMNLKTNINSKAFNMEFPSPTGVNYYELEEFIV